MATVTADKPSVRRGHSSVGSSTQVREQPATRPEIFEPVADYEAPKISTVKRPADVTFPKVQVLPERRPGLLIRMVHSIRDTAFGMGIGSPSGSRYRNPQALSSREKTERDAGLMGFPQF